MPYHDLIGAKNPVYARLHSRGWTYRYQAQLINPTTIATGVLFGLLFGVGLGNVWGIPLLAVFCGLTPFILGVTAALFTVQNVTQPSHEILLTTPIRASQIVWGYFAVLPVRLMFYGGITCGVIPYIVCFTFLFTSIWFVLIGDFPADNTRLIMGLGVGSVAFLGMYWASMMWGIAIALATRRFNHTLAGITALMLGASFVWLIGSSTFINVMIQPFSPDIPFIMGYLLVPYGWWVMAWLVAIRCVRYPLMAGV